MRMSNEHFVKFLPFMFVLIMILNASYLCVVKPHRDGRTFPGYT